MRGVIAMAGMGLMLAGCATGPTRFPVLGERYHSDPIAQRGTITVEAAPNTAADSAAFVAAVEGDLARVGFTPAPAGSQTQYRAIVSVTRATQPLPPRSSPISIGIGGASFGGGRRSFGGVGGGVSFPVGGGHAREGVLTDLAVRIVRGPDAIWDGHTRTLADAATPAAASDATAQRLARPLFDGFPGQSGRSIEVR